MYHSQSQVRPSIKLCSGIAANRLRMFQDGTPAPKQNEASSRVQPEVTIEEADESEEVERSESQEVKQDVKLRVLNEFVPTLYLTIALCSP